ncbi:MAG: MFS transporter [Acidimicrobiales bacterium]
MFRLVARNPSFRRLFLAHATSRAGDAFNTVALVVLVFRLTGSGLGVAATVAFEVAPIVLLGPIAGVIADRYPRRRVMVAADLFRAGLAGLLVAAHGTLALAYGVAFGLSVGSLLFNPAAASLVPEVVDDDDLVDANSALWTVAVVAQIVLAPVAGALIVWAGVGAAFALNAASYLGSAWWLRRLDVAVRPAAVPAGGWHSVRAGIDVVRGNALLTRLAVVQILASLSAGATSGLLVVLAADWLKVGPSGFGLLLSCIAVGAAAGPLLLRRFIRPLDKRWLFGPYAVRALVDLALAGVSSPFAAGPALAVYGVSTSTGMVTYQTTLQRVVPGDVRGRAFALYDVLWNAARLVSLGLAGVLADALSIRVVYLLGGILLLAAAAVGLGAPLTERPADSTS